MPGKPLGVAGTATHPRNAALAAGHAAGSRVDPSGAAADAGGATLAARAAAGTFVHSSPTAVAVGVAAASARFVHGDKMRERSGGRGWNSRNSVGSGHRCGQNRCSDSPGRHQGPHEV